MASSIDADRAAGYRPTVRIALTHYGQVLVGRLPSKYDEKSDTIREYPWDLFQGGIEPGETLQEAFKREAREEIGHEWFFFSRNIQFLYKDQDERPVEKDGKKYRGKTYYVCTAPLVTVPQWYDEVTNGHDDEYTHDPLVYPANEYWVLLMNYIKAQQSVQRTQRMKAPALLRAMHELRARNLLMPEGDGFSFVNLSYINRLPPGDPLRSYLTA